MSTRVAPVTGHGSPTRDTPLEKADSFSSRSHQLSITLKLGWELVSPSHLHAIVLTGLTLSRSSAGNQNFREFMSVVVWPCFKDTILLWSFSTYGFYNLLVCKGPWVLMGGEWYSYLICGWAFHWCLFCPVVSSCVSCCSLHKEASLVRSESCTKWLRVTPWEDTMYT